MKTFKGDLILKKDMVFKDSINVEGNIICKNERFNLTVDGSITATDISAWNISARNINAGNINAGNINAWDINAWNISAGNINAWDINAWNINAWDINAGDINAWDINACDINAVCFAYNNITCKSIEGRREHCKHFVLDGKKVQKK